MLLIRSVVQNKFLVYINNSTQTENFKKLCDWFEKECELYTIYELFKQMKLFSDDPDDPFQFTSMLVTSRGN